ncbi:MAG: hypothetical protein RR642_14660, partial [Solibacillus sp.]
MDSSTAEKIKGSGHFSLKSTSVSKHLPSYDILQHRFVKIYDMYLRLSFGEYCLISGKSIWKIYVELSAFLNNLHRMQLILTIQMKKLCWEIAIKIGFPSIAFFNNQTIANYATVSQ